MSLTSDPTDSCLDLTFSTNPKHILPLNLTSSFTTDNFTWSALRALVKTHNSAAFIYSPLKQTADKRSVISRRVRKEKINKYCLNSWIFSFEIYIYIYIILFVSPTKNRLRTPLRTRMRPTGAAVRKRHLMSSRRPPNLHLVHEQRRPGAIFSHDLKTLPLFSPSLVPPQLVTAHPFPAPN